MVCPKCGNNYCKITAETKTKATDYSICSGICGEMLLGPAGFACGFSDSRDTEATAYWVCPKCGNRFKA